MNPTSTHTSESLGNWNFILGIEGGGTKTTWVLMDRHSNVLCSGEEGGGNFHLIKATGLKSLLAGIRRKLSQQPDCVGLCMAGLSADALKLEAQKIAEKTWPGAERIVVGEDTRSGYCAALGYEDGIFVIAGTGSNVFAQKGDKTLRLGGWGHLLGDHGSGWAIAQQAMKMAFAEWDEVGKTSRLAQGALSFFGENKMTDLCRRVYAFPSKDGVAAFAPRVIQLAERGDEQAQQIVLGQAFALADSVNSARMRLRLKKPLIGLVGGLFEKSEFYRGWFETAVRSLFEPSAFILAMRKGAEGAAMFAASHLHPHATPGGVMADLSISTLATEQRNQRARNLHKRSVSDLVELFISEEQEVNLALKKAQKEITRACMITSQAIVRGGRILYVGAGTSGRLGILDASEMPPTFSVDPETVQGIIAGGMDAVFRPKEGAEDNPVAGAEAVAERGVGKDDVVWGISASGRTPFVVGGLERAGQLGASTVMLCCNPGLNHSHLKPDVTIKLATGPEIIAGSTRLKAGTATKIVLNMISSIAMIRSGRVYDNLMINVSATNEKLRARAAGLVSILAGCEINEAMEALKKASWKVSAAVRLVKPVRSVVSKRTRKK